MKFFLVLLCGWLLLLTQASRADVKLPSLFSDHMVLDRSARTPVWGWAAPNEAITVTLKDQAVKATADRDGKWKLTLDLTHSGSGPFQMEVTGSNTILIHDVVIGQVWLASGQSNMALTLRETQNAGAEIAQSTNPMLRQFQVKNVGRPLPADACEGAWMVATPATTPTFTAVGYYFGQRLQAKIHQPIGIIDASWGGTIIEAWISAQAIHRLPALQAETAVRHQIIADYPAQQTAFTQAFENWQKTTGRQDQPSTHPELFAGAAATANGWSTVMLPGSLNTSGLPRNGALWLRREVDIPPGLEKLPVKIGLGRITGFQTVYWNGEKVTETTPRLYPGAGHVTYFGLDPKQVHPGKNILAVRVYAPTEPFALEVAPQQFTAGPVSLAGAWQAKAEYTLPPLAPTDLATVPKGPGPEPGSDASVIFNGVIHPLVPYALAGVIWYQGESNAGNAHEYRAEFPLLINDWRAQWSRPDLPFYFCQLANSLPKTTHPGPSQWAELREAQSMALQLPDTAQAVLIDLGDSDDLHYRDKKDVGERLARIALARQYGQPQPYSGPVYESMAIEGSTIQIQLAHADGGLIARPLPATYSVRSLVGQTAPLIANSPGSQLEGFSICGTDRKWVWANARIDGTTVVVWSDQVSAPTAVRYGWAENPTCNLYNGAGLPASPFRTDDFPSLTEKNHF